MRFIRIIFLIVMAFQTFAQGGWKKKYFFQNDSFSVAYNSIETPTGDFIIVGLTSDTADNYSPNRLTLIGTDHNGNLLWKKSYGDSTTRYANISNNNVFDNSGFYQTVSLGEISLLIKFNYNGDTLWQKKYYANYPSDYLTIMNLTRSVDGGFLMTGVYDGVFMLDERCLVMKTDKFGNELWRKISGIVNVNSIIGHSIIQDSATKTIIVTGSTFDINNSCGWLNRYSYIRFMDSLGTLKFVTSYNKDNGGGPFNKVIQLKDGNFLTGGENVTMGPIYTSPFLVKFDIQGNVIWFREYRDTSEYNHIDHFYELPNNDIVVTSLFDNNYYFRKLLYVRLNKDGWIKEKKYIGTPNFQDTLSNYNSEKATSLHPTKDGGFILTTSFPSINVFWNTENHPYSVIKLDANGCDTALSACSQNLYVNIQESNLGIEPDLSIYPNPSAEILNIEANTYFSNKFEIVIQDLQGKTLDRYNIHNGSKLSINTSIYPPGLYIVQLESEGKRLSSKKLSIYR